MDVILHLDRGTEPATGWLKEGPESTSLVFTGYMELLGLLETLRAVTTSEPAVAGEGQGRT